MKKSLYLIKGNTIQALKKQYFKSAPFDKVYIGIHIDFNHVATVVIEESKSKKTLLAFNIFSYEAQEFNFENDFEKLIGKFPDILDNLIKQLSDYGDIYQSIIKTLKQKNAIAITIDQNTISSHIINIPKKAKKEKKSNNKLVCKQRN